MSNKKKYLIYIPDLVSLEFDKESELKKVYKSQYDFYGLTHEKFKFHFKVKNNNEKSFFSNLRKKSTFNTYGCGLSRGIFWYERSFLIANSQFAFDDKSKTFYINQNYIYKKLFSILKIGEFFYPHDLIKEFINLTLYLNGYMTLPGYALNNGNNNIVAVVPRSNGKTTYVSRVLEQNKDSSYISDNEIVINLNSMKLYPTAPLWSIKKSSSKRISEKLQNDEGRILSSALQVKKLYFVLNKKNDDITDIHVNDFLVPYSSLGFVYLLLRDYILLKSYGDKLLKITNDYIDILKKLEKESKAEIKYITNYNFSELDNDQ